MTAKYQDPIEAITNAASYETLQKDNPRLLEAIQGLINQNVSAKNIERWARRNYGKDNLIVLLVAGAAHHIEAQKKG